MYKKIDLNNGIRVVLNTMPYMESSTVGIWIGTGSRAETERISGISHFLEHMLFKGTPSRSARKIKETIEGRGGALNAFTSEEITCYLAKVSGRHLAIALDVLSDMVLHANLAKKDIDRERTVIMEEIKMYQDIPNHHVHDILSGLMWPSHPLGRPIAGNIQSVSFITREDMVDYKKTSYIPENIVLVLCGNLNPEDVVKKIKKIFSVGSKEMQVPSVRFDRSQSVPQLEILCKDTAQSHLSMGVHTFGRMHEDRYVLSLLHIILGANMSSRLFENVREKRGLAYAIGSEIKRYKDTGGFIINAGIEHKKVREAVSLIIKELVRIKDKPVSRSELKRAKEFFNVQFLLALEDTLEHMLFLGEYVISSSILPNKDDIIKKVNSVTARDLQRVARSIFTANKLNMAIIGQLEDKERSGIEKEMKGL